MKKTLSFALFLVSLAVVTGQTTVTFRVIPSFGPPQNSSSFLGYAANAVSLIKITGTLPIGERTSPTDACLIQHIMPEDLMTTTSLPFYRGVFSTITPWNNERGGTVWWWVEVTANEGETVSLSDISMVLSSSDFNNILGKTVSYSGSNITYSVTSPGIKVDGSEITSGLANQQVKRVIVGIGSKSFPISSTANVLAVRDFINKFPNWRTTSMAIVKGITNTSILLKMPPSLRVVKAGDRFLVTAENNGDPIGYELQTSVILGSSGVWNSVGTIWAGQTNDMGAIQDYSTLFVRYAPF